MGKGQRIKSPLGLRIFTWFGGVMLAVLLIWLMGMALHDIGSFREVRRDTYEAQQIPREQVDLQRSLQRKIDVIKRKSQSEREQANLKKEQAETAKQTLTSLVQLERADVEKGVPVSEERQAAVNAAQQRLLDAQDAHNKRIESIAALSAEQADLAAQLRDVDADIQKGRNRANQLYYDEMRKLHFQAGMLKILILLPVVAVAGWFFAKKRKTPLAPIAWSVGAAVLWELISVIHMHFPNKLGKYVFLLTAVLVVLRLLMMLIRSAIRPSVNTLVKRYREAYRKAQCPVCGYPMAIGKAPFARMAQLLATKRFTVAAPAEAGTERPYTCPSCGEPLFEECADCGKLRHSLLPSCTHCGATKELSVSAEDPAPEVG